MNRQQRRLAERNNKKEDQSIKYAQGMQIATEAYRKGHDRGQDAAETNQAQIFMYAFALMIKTLHEQWGWGCIRLARLTQQVLDEYNNNDMSLEELEQWCWKYGGFKLQIDDSTK